MSNPGKILLAVVLVAVTMWANFAADTQHKKDLSDEQLVITTLSGLEHRFPMRGVECEYILANARPEVSIMWKCEH